MDILIFNFMIRRRSLLLKQEKLTACVVSVKFFLFKTRFLFIMVALYKRYMC